METQAKFEKLVMLLAENSDNGNLELDEEITAFEDAIEKTRCGEAYFGIAKSDWERIEIIKPDQIPWGYKKDNVRFYAEYYDGNQAPFTVCKWCDDFEKLEELLKITSYNLYKKYQKVVLKDESLE